MARVHNLGLLIVNHQKHSLKPYVLLWDFFIAEGDILIVCVLIKAIITLIMLYDTNLLYIYISLIVYILIKVTIFWCISFIIFGIQGCKTAAPALFREPKDFEP